MTCSKYAAHILCGKTDYEITMKQLQKTVNELLTYASNEEKLASLAKAFEGFSLETLRLENAYETLNEQFQSLNLELQETNHKLQSKVAELDVLTDYLRSILDNIAQGILFIDFSGVITTYNRGAESILGISSQKAVFHQFWDSFKDDIFGFSLREVLEKQQAPVNCLASYTTPTNIHCDLEVVTTFALKSDYKNQGLIIMIRDVTEVRQLQTLATRADRMKMLGELAAQVAHEIRNPLGGIKGYASLLVRDLADRPKQQQMSAYIVEGTDHLNSLVSQVLSFARPVHPHLEVTDLVALMHEVKMHMLADANLYEKNITIEIDTSSETVWLPADQALFKSAMLNLIVNSIQAMPHGGEILLTLRENPRNVILSLSDTGTGISDENMARLYTPFFTTKPEGNGLGLAEVAKSLGQ